MKKAFAFSIASLGAALLLSSCSTPPEILERSQAQLELYDKAIEAQKTLAKAIAAHRIDLDRQKSAVEIAEKNQTASVKSELDGKQAAKSPQTQKDETLLSFQKTVLEVSRTSATELDSFLKAGDKSSVLDNAKESSEKLKNATKIFVDNGVIEP